MKLKLLALICTLSSLAAGVAVHAQDATPPARQRGGGFREMEGLSADDKAKVTAARDTAMKDPKVQAAQEKMAAARKEYTQAMDAAMIAADPSIEPILKKIQAAREQGGGRRGAPAAGADAPKAAQ